MISCNKPVTDFGFNGVISGTVKDASGNIVGGDITSANFIVRVQAKGDLSTIDMRVKGDGTFINDKLYPGISRVWISGPVIAATTDTVTLDLSGGQNIVHDFVVTPVFTIAVPVISGTPAATSVNIIYSITANSSKTPSKMALYCSTVPYPNTSTGSGPFYSTVAVTLTTKSGTVNVPGLTASTQYFLRIGSQSSTTVMNYSDQIIFTTPASK